MITTLDSITAVSTPSEAGRWRPTQSNLGRDYNEPQVWISDDKPGVKISRGNVGTPYYITNEAMPGWFTRAATLDEAATVVAQVL